MWSLPAGASSRAASWQFCIRFQNAMFEPVPPGLRKTTDNREFGDRALAPDGVGLAGYVTRCHAVRVACCLDDGPGGIGRATDDPRGLSGR